MFFGYWLADDFSVFGGHVKEGLDRHAALIPVLTLTHGHDAIGNFLLADDEEKSANEALPEKFILKIVDVRDNFFVE